jgi:hypothetical protein
VDHLERLSHSGKPTERRAEDLVAGGHSIESSREAPGVESHAATKLCGHAVRTLSVALHERPDSPLLRREAETFERLCCHGLFRHASTIPAESGAGQRAFKRCSRRVRTSGAIRSFTSGIRCSLADGGRAIDAETLESLRRTHGGRVGDCGCSLYA